MQHRHAAGETATAVDMDHMPGMDTGDSMSSMGVMMMSVFQTSIVTPLYSMAWTPRNKGTYAATCIFLIALAAVLRGLLALRHYQESRWLDKELNRRYVAVAGKLPLAETISRDSIAKHMTLTENGVEEDVMVVMKKSVRTRPWRVSVDPLRALIDMVIAGLGYLLMLAVMTMNVGYFLSVLGGTFLGSLLVGRYAVTGEH